MEGANEKRKVTLDRQRALMLHYDGFCAKEIAEKLGVVPATVKQFLRKMDIADNPPKRPEGGKRTRLEQDVIDAGALGMSYGEFKSQYPLGLPEEQQHKSKRKGRRKK